MKKKLILLSSISIGILTLKAQTVIYQTLHSDATFAAKSINTNLPAGSIGAVAQVANSTFNYQIPIQIPAGTNGVAPNLSINYSSGGADGSLGKGWALSGVSMITRSLKTINHDGLVDAVNLNSSDVFAIDGLRMVGTSGNYGANGAKYSKEVEDFSQITSYGATGSGPTYFILESKEGVEYEYGNSADSKFNSTGSSILFWMLNKVKYKDGNYTEYIYETITNTAGSEIRLKEILYTGNSLSSPVLLPYNKITFQYKSKGSLFEFSTYEVSKAITNNSLLTNIVISNKNDATSTYDLVKQYNLNYANNDINIYLNEVEEVGSDGVSKLNSTIFKYGDKSTEVSYNYIGLTSSTPTDLIIGDYNGDGYSDIAQANTTVIDGQLYHQNVTVYTKSPSSSNNTFFNSYTISLPGNGKIGETSSKYNFMAGDYNGDGFDDLAYVILAQGGCKYAGNTKIYLNNGTATPTLFTINYPGNGPCYNNAITANNRFFIPGDYNGDGIKDILLVLKNYATSDTYLYIWFGGSNATSYSTVTLSGSSWFSITNWLSKDINSFDFDGDGKDEIMLTKGSKSEVFSFNGSIMTSKFSAGFPTEWHLIYPGDFNGDRKTDLLVRAGLTDGPWYVNYSTGTNWEAPIPFTFISNAPNINEYYQGDKIVIGDFNADGKFDIARSLNFGTYYMHYYNSRGKTFKYSGSYSQSTPITSFNNVSGDFYGDGTTDFVNKESTTSPVYIFKMNAESEENLIKKIKNGEGHVTSVSYDRMTKLGGHYTKNTNTNYPNITVKLPIYLVTSIKKDLEDYIKYNYTDAIFNKEGKGFLGFKKVTEYNSNTYHYNDYQYVLNTSFATLVLDKIVNRYSTTPLSESRMTNVLQQQNSGLPKILWHKVTEVYTDKFFEQGFTKNLKNTFDTDGNTLSETYIVGSKVSSLESVIETTNTTRVFGMYGSFRKNVITSETVTNTRLSESPYSITNNYTYNTKGQALTKIEFWGLPNALTHTYTYNTLGNKTGVTMSSAGVSSRSSTSTYDSKGRFPISATNTLSQISYSTWDTKWAKPILTTGIDGIKTYYEYDVFGREKKTTYKYTTAEAYFTQTSYGWSSDPYASYFQLLSHPAKPDLKIHFDKAGRKVLEEKESCGGYWVNQRYSYDLLGHLVQHTGPHRPALSETGLVTTYTFDAYLRPSQTINPQRTITTTYTISNGNITNTNTVNSSPVQTSSRTADATGKFISSSDNGGTLNFNYFSNGKTKSILNGATVVSSYQYDAYMNQTQNVDVNAGIYNYTYNIYGELKSQTNPANITTNFAYNNLGQITSKSWVENFVTNTITYSYYTSGVSKNLLNTITNFNGISERYTYDSYGRVASKRDYLDNTYYYTYYLYNIYNDVTKITYPNSEGINYAYDGNGFINTIKNLTNTVTHFTNQGMNEYESYKSYKLGNNKTTTLTFSNQFITNINAPSVQNLTLNWDYKVGNLTSRIDGIKGKTENFIYDILNRLKSTQVVGGTLYTMNYSQDGNMIEKSDAAGQYGLQYTASNINGVSVVKNPISIPQSTLDIAYSSYQRPLSITENNQKIEFTYSSDFERRKAVFKTNNVIQETRYYFGNFERQVIGSTNKYIYYISNGENLIAIVEKVGSATTNNYVYTDHLGSILTLTNASGTVVAEQNYDAWGQKRNTSNWTYVGVQSVPTMLYRGYTGHEAYPQFNLINMNARLYDPLSGRMLSPDIAVSSPYSSQGYNRYTYANNNPLNTIDPDGNNPVAAIIIGAAIAITTNGVVNTIKGDRFFNNWVQSAVIGAISGGISSAIGGVTSMVSVTTPVDKVGLAIAGSIMHGTASTFITAAQGGNPIHGFGSGSVGSLSSSAFSKTGSAGQIIGGGLGGGIGAELTGGSFSEGLVYGLISGTLNHAAHSMVIGGVFGEDIAMAYLTGQMRHILGPDFVGVEAEVGAALLLAGVRFSKGKIMALRGSDDGKAISNTEVGQGVGWDAALGVSVTKYYFSGPRSEIRLSILSGTSFQFTGGGTILGVDVGLQAAYANITVNQMGYKVYSLGFSLGFTGAPINISGSFFVNNLFIDK